MARTGLRHLIVATFALCFVSGAAAQTSDLVSKSAFRVCADPANLPMSSQDQSGYENKIAELFAGKLSLPLQYTWYPMATGFIRNTLRANKCDIVIGYAQGHELVLNSNHYLVSAYVLIVGVDGELSNVTSLSDPALQGRKLGIIAGTPPSSHMARHRLMAKAKPYSLFVDRRYESPIPNMLKDLDEGVIDGAVVWGPLGGPIVKSDYKGLKIIPLLKEKFPPRLFFRITMGVRQGELTWRRKLNSLIRRNQNEINQILVEAGVPMLNASGTELIEIAQ